MNNKPLVGIIMGSKSDLPVMQPAADFLKEFEIPYEIDIVSAHRTPDRMSQYGQSALDKGLKVIIAGAGGAAHLPGMIASHTVLPVVGVPVKSSNSIQGIDSLLSIVQMPNGVPVASVAINASLNAAILAAQILGTSDEFIKSKLLAHKEKLKEKVKKQVAELKAEQN